MRLFRQHHHKRQRGSNDRRFLLLGGVVLLLVGIWVFLQMLDQPSHSESSPGVESNAASSPPNKSPGSSDHDSGETFTFYKTLQSPADAKSESPGLEPKSSVILKGRTAGPATDPSDHIQKTRSKGYAVQVAAFRDRPAAMNLVHRLEGKKYPAYLLAVVTSGQETWYRVRVGPYTTRAQAEDVARRLKAKEQLGSYIARSTEAH